MDPGELRKPIPPPRRGVTLEALVLSAMALATIAGFIALGIWQDLAAEHRARLVFAISLAMIGRSIVLAHSDEIGRLVEAAHLPGPIRSPF